MAQRSSPILPLTSGIGTVSPVNVGGPGSAEEAFRNQQGVLQRLLSGLGGGNNISLEDLARSQFRDRQDLATGLESAGSSRFSPGQSVDITGQSNQILPPGFSSTDLTPIPGSIGMSEVPVTGAPDLSTAQSGLRRGPLGLDMTAIDDNPFSISAPMPSDEANRLASLFGITPKGQQSFSDLISGIGRIIAPRETPRERKERAAKGEAFRRSEDAIGGTLFGDAVNVTPAQAQETAGILTKLIQDSATRGEAETAATEGEGSGTTVQGDVTDITDQPDDTVEQRTDSAEDVEGINLGTGTDESPAETAFKSGYDAYLEALGESKDIGSIEDYKKEFADATGIDISGKVDNSAALMAFGLALMQNKAGKGFNVGNILSSVGEAGEAALPLMAQAKKEARAAKLAGGKYALEQRKAAKANRQALLEAERDRLNELTKMDLDFRQKKRLKEIEFALEADLKRLEHEQTLLESEFEGVDLYLDSTEEVPLFEGAGKAFTVNAFKQNPNLPKKYKDEDIPLKLTTSARTLRPIFDAAERDLNRLENDLAGIAEIALQDGISVQQQATAGIRSFGRAFGINVDSDLSPLEQARQTLKRIEVRRTAEILGEAGKTISDADRALVTQIVGEIGGLTLTDLTGADAKRLVNRLNELHGIIVVKGRNNLDTARQRLTGTDYDLGASGGSQQPTGMEVGETRDMGGVSVKRTG